MKINAISADYSALKARNVDRKNSVSSSVGTENPPQGVSVISFKGGNKEQAIFFAAETKPYFQVGGVATVMEDMRALRVSENDPVMDSAYKKSFEYWKPKNKVFVDGIYNGQKVYNKETGMLETIQVAKIPSNLPENSAFKQFEGKYFMTKSGQFQKNVDAAEFFKNEEKIIQATQKPNLQVNNNIFILDDVTGGKKMLDFGDTGESEIKLFRVLRYDKDQKKLRPTNDFKVFTDLTASMVQPYADGSYSTSPKPLGQTWKGDPYAKLAKGFVELTPRICEVVSADGVKFDPATAVLNDSQAFWATEYMAQKAVTGDEFWKGKKPTMILHNAGDSYTQVTSFQNMFVDIADKELRSAIENDPKYIEALKRGPSHVEEYFKTLVPKELLDSQGKVSGFMAGLYYADKNYVPMVSTVSEGYYKKLISDPDFQPAVYQKLKDLAAKDRFKGILNAFENEGLNPYTLPGMEGYKQENYLGKGTQINGQDGFKTKPYVAFDKTKVNENFVDMEHVREVKRQNKISLLERFDKEVLEKLEELKDVKGHEYDFNIAVTGLPDKNVKVYGHIDKKYIEEVKKPNSDVKVLTSWGRGDVQKALDSVLNSYAKYIHKYGDKDPNTLLVMGGALDSSEDSQNIRKILEKMNNDPKLKGRFVYLDGFAPNKPLAMAADFSVFPSRFAPCELTDLESMKVFCSPIVTDCQGLGQKNFDASFAGEADKVTGYKTKHEYAMTLDELRNALPEKASEKGVLDKEKLDKTLNKMKYQIMENYRLTHAGSEISEQIAMEQIRKSAGLHYEYSYKILRPFRDQVVEDDLVNCFERALIEDRNKDVQTKMVANQLKQYTDWERNAKLSETGKSSAELYREWHFKKDGGQISEEDTLLSKLRKNCKEAIERSRGNGASVSGEVENGGVRRWFMGHKKASIIAGGALGLAALGYVGYKTGWLNPRFEDEKKNGHLSCVG